VVTNLGAPRWLAAAGELVLIVVGILLALAIDQWREDQADAAAELESLQLLARDLGQVMEQLEEYIEVVDNTSTSAAAVFDALTGPRGEIDEAATSDYMLALILRRTMRLPRAAYTDLLSTGNLRLIRDRDLRDAVVQFYESAERSEAIFLKNTEVFVDGMATQVLVGGGLMLPRPMPPSDYTYALVSEAFSAAEEKLGANRTYDTDPFWSLDADSPEWDRVRSVSLMLARNAVLNRVLAEGLLEEAQSLHGLLAEAIDRRGTS
jgi:hypothetical protein